MEPYHYPDAGPIAFRKERDMGQVIGDALSLTVQTIGEWGPAVLLFAGPFHVLAAVADGLAGGGAAIGSLGSMAGAMLVTATVFAYIRMYRDPDAEPVTVEALWARTTPLIGPVFGISLVFGIALAILIVPAALASASALEAGEVPTAGMILGILALVALVLLLPYFVVSLPSRLLDTDDLSDAFARARALIRPHRGFATVTSLLIYLLLGFITMVLGGSLGALLGLLGASPIVEALATTALILVLLPATVFSNVASVLLFETLVEREEGTLLDAEIEAIRDSVPDDEARQPVVPSPMPPSAARDAPDTRSFAERLRDDRRPSGDELATDDSADDASSPRPTGFRGGGFGDVE